MCVVSLGLTLFTYTLPKYLSDELRNKKLGILMIFLFKGKFVKANHPMSHVRPWSTAPVVIHLALQPCLTRHRCKIFIQYSCCGSYCSVVLEPFARTFAFTFLLQWKLSLGYTEDVHLTKTAVMMIHCCMTLSFKQIFVLFS